MRWAVEATDPLLEGWWVLVAERNTQAKVIGPAPILFVSVGPCADGALVALSETAREMAVPAQGPFGLVSLDPSGNALRVAHWTWLSDFEVPASPEVCGLSEDVASSDERLLATISSLVRQLRSQEPAADPASPARVRMSSYVIIDLSVAESVACVVRLMRIVRRADPGHDMAILGLTGLTATSEPESESDEAWFDRWKQLLGQLQDEPLAQKIYLLDGRNASGTWLDRPGQLDRLGAEFLLHHGITCRGPLRQTERRRVSPKENILSVCGSFGARKIAVDLPEVAERVARRLACEDLADLYQQNLSEDAREHIEEGAQALVEKIEHLYETADQVKPRASDRTAADPGACALGNEDVSQAIRKTVNHVCAHEPLVSLCHLLKCLRPRLRGLLTRLRLLERERMRCLVGETLQRQQEETYEPMRMWLSRPGTKWDSRFTPAQGAPAHAALGCVPSAVGYRVGATLFVLGLISIAGGLFWQDRIFVLGGGLLSLAASVLMTLPTGWIHEIRRRVPYGRDIPESVPFIFYRRRLPVLLRGAALVLAATGLTAIVWSLWPGAWSLAMSLLVGVSAFVAVVGVSILLGGPVQMRPDQVSEREAPGHLCPPVWTWRAVGLLCLAVGWVVLCLCASAPRRVDTVVQWGAHVGGLVCLVAAAILGLRPRTGRVRLVDHASRVPEPFSGGIAGPPADSDAIREVTAMMQWIDRATLEPKECGLRGGPGGVGRHCEVLFDLLAPDWDRQLAETFRRTLESRSKEAFSNLAREPKGWSSCLVRQLEAPSTECTDLAVIFALEAVKAWMDSLTLKELVACLDVDLARFNRLATRVASPNWPATRVAPDVGVGVVAVGRALRDVLKPRTQAPGVPAVVELDWNSMGEDVFVLRIVQGLTEGWRGYPAMPGQQREPLQTRDPRSSESDDRQDTAQIPSGG